MIPLSEIERARDALRGRVARTPLVSLDVVASTKIWLKLENLQPIGSFKIRGAFNAIARADGSQLARGVVTASAGNMAQGVAYVARELGIPATIVVPDSAPQTKIAAIKRLGGRVVAVPFEEWWHAIATGETHVARGFFVHPVWDEPVMAGNATIGLEILEDVPDPDLVVIPWGGGGLTTGIASAVKALRPETRVATAEPETAAPVAAALSSGGAPREIDFSPSFIDGAGARALLPNVWERARDLVDEAHVVSLDETASAIRLLAERVRVIAEGAGALAPAAALSGRADGRKIVCVVSGGNIDAAVLAQILRGETPR